MKLLGVEKLIFLVMLLIFIDVFDRKCIVVCSCVLCRYLNMVWLR